MVARKCLLAPSTTLVIRFVLIVLLASTAFLLFARESNACSFTRPGSPTVELQKSTYVFAGKVVAVHRVPNDEVYEFKVDTVWKGPLYETTYIVGLLESYAGTSCAGSLRPFALGRNYLVYDDNHVASLTGLLEHKSEDLAELGKGRSPTSGTKAPIPEILQETRNAPRPREDQSTTPAMMSPTPVPTNGKETPTFTPRSLTQSSTLEGATPVPRLEAERTIPTPPASEQRTSLQWPLVVLLALLAAALIGSVALVRTRRTRQIEE